MRSNSSWLKINVRRKLKWFKRKSIVKRRLFLYRQSLPSVNQRRRARRPIGALCHDNRLPGFSNFCHPSRGVKKNKPKRGVLLAKDFRPVWSASPLGWPKGLPCPRSVRRLACRKSSTVLYTYPAFRSPSNPLNSSVVSRRSFVPELLTCPLGGLKSLRKRLVLANSSRKGGLSGDGSRKKTGKDKVSDDPVVSQAEVNQKQSTPKRGRGRPRLADALSLSKVEKPLPAPDGSETEKALAPEGGSTLDTEPSEPAEVLNIIVDSLNKLRTPTQAASESELEAEVVSNSDSESDGEIEGESEVKVGSKTVAPRPVVMPVDPVREAFFETLYPEEEPGSESDQPEEIQTVRQVLKDYSQADSYETAANKLEESKSGDSGSVVPTVSSQTTQGETASLPLEGSKSVDSVSLVPTKADGSKVGVVEKNTEGEVEVDSEGEESAGKGKKRVITIWVGTPPSKAMKVGEATRQVDSKTNQDLSWKTPDQLKIFMDGAGTMPLESLNSIQYQSITLWLTDGMVTREAPKGNVGVAKARFTFIPLPLQPLTSDELKRYYLFCFLIGGFVPGASIPGTPHNHHRSNILAASISAARILCKNPSYWGFSPLKPQDFISSEKAAIAKMYQSPFSGPPLRTVVVGSPTEEQGAVYYVATGALPNYEKRDIGAVQAEMSKWLRSIFFTIPEMLEHFHFVKSVLGEVSQINYISQQVWEEEFCIPGVAFRNIFLEIVKGCGKPRIRKYDDSFFSGNQVNDADYFPPVFDSLNRIVFNNPGTEDFLSNACQGEKLNLHIMRGLARNIICAKLDGENWQVIGWFYGGAGAGKTRMVDLFKLLANFEEATQELNLDLNRFSNTQLVGCTMLTVSDLVAAPKSLIQQLKTISGKDSMYIEYKHRQGNDKFVPYCQVIVTSNYAPDKFNNIHRDIGMSDRLVCMYFDPKKSVSPNQREISAQRDWAPFMSDIVNWALSTSTDSLHHFQRAEYWQGFSDANQGRSLAGMARYLQENYLYYETKSDKETVEVDFESMDRLVNQDTEKVIAHEKALIAWYEGSGEDSKPEIQPPVSGVDAIPQVSQALTGLDGLTVPEKNTDPVQVEIAGTQTTPPEVSALDSGTPPEVSALDSGTPPEVSALDSGTPPEVSALDSGTLVKEKTTMPDQAEIANTQTQSTEGPSLDTTVQATPSEVTKAAKKPEKKVKGAEKKYQPTGVIRKPGKNHLRLSDFNTEVTAFQLSEDESFIEEAPKDTQALITLHKDLAILTAHKEFGVTLYVNRSSIAVSDKNGKRARPQGFLNLQKKIFLSDGTFLKPENWKTFDSAPKAAPETLPDPFLGQDTIGWLVNNPSLSALRQKAIKASLDAKNTSTQDEVALAQAKALVEQTAKELAEASKPVAGSDDQNFSVIIKAYDEWVSKQKLPSNPEALPDDEISLRAFEDRLRLSYLEEASARAELSKSLGAKDSSQALKTLEEATLKLEKHQKGYEEFVYNLKAAKKYDILRTDPHGKIRADLITGLTKVDPQDSVVEPGTPLKVSKVEKKSVRGKACSIQSTGLLRSLPPIIWGYKRLLPDVDRRAASMVKCSTKDYSSEVSLEDQLELDELLSEPSGPLESERIPSREKTKAEVLQAGCSASLNTPLPKVRREVVLPSRALKALENFALKACLMPPIGHITYNPLKPVTFSAQGEEMVKAVVALSKHFPSCMEACLPVSEQQSLIYSAFERLKEKELLKEKEANAKALLEGNPKTKPSKGKGSGRSFFTKTFSYRQISTSFYETEAPRVAASGGTIHGMRTSLKAEVLKQLTDTVHIQTVDFDMSACHTRVAVSMLTGRDRETMIETLSGGTFWPDQVAIAKGIFEEEGVLLSKENNVKSFLKVAVYTSLNGGNPCSEKLLCYNLSQQFGPEIRKEKLNPENLPKSTLYFAATKVLERFPVRIILKDLNKKCAEVVPLMWEYNQRERENFAAKRKIEAANLEEGEKLKEAYPKGMYQNYCLSKRDAYVFDSAHKGISRVVQSYEVVLMAALTGYIIQRGGFIISLEHDGVLCGFLEEVDPRETAKFLTEDLDVWARYLKISPLPIEFKISAYEGVIKEGP